MQTDVSVQCDLARCCCYDCVLSNCSMRPGVGRRHPGVLVQGGDIGTKVRDVVRYFWLAE